MVVLYWYSSTSAVAIASDGSTVSSDGVCNALTSTYTMRHVLLCGHITGQNLAMDERRSSLRNMFLSRPCLLAGIKGAYRPCLTGSTKARWSINVA